MNKLLNKVKTTMAEFNLSEDGAFDLRLFKEEPVELTEPKAKPAAPKATTETSAQKAKPAQPAATEASVEVMSKKANVKINVDTPANTENLVTTPKASLKKAAPKKTTVGGVAETKVTEERETLVDTYIDVVTKSLQEVLNPRTLMEMEEDKARKELEDSIQLIIDHFQFNLSPNEENAIKKHIISDMLGHGPLEDLIADDDVSDIMVNSFDKIFIEKNGKIIKTDIKFRSPEHLNNTCRRIVQKVGRRVDNSSPICDARLMDGSRVNVIMPPLSLRGASLTIRKFKKDKLTLEKLVHFGTLDERGAELLKIIAKCRVNVIVSGGTGSGKTTMLNCLTKYIDQDERIITCEDSAELQLQQPHVVTLETRDSNNESLGEITMRDLVKNCLRMRPERIIVGEVRGSEAFDLLQAMNTGHDGSMGTLHANTPRDAMSRLESMIAMANLNLPNSSIKEQIASSLNVIVHVQRLHDGSRKVTHISEISGSEAGVYLMNDLYSFKTTGKDAEGKIQGHHEMACVQPRFYEKVVQYGLDEKLMELMGRRFD